MCNLGYYLLYIKLKLIVIIEYIYIYEGICM